jgi:UDP-3-O-[3-hydroxymyristoyl] glucosamine N-acyltransferase
MTQFTAADLAERVGGELEGDGSIEIRGLETVDKAGEHDLTFVGDKRHARAWGASKAGSVVLSNGLELAERDGTFALIRVSSADHAMITLLELFKDAPKSGETGIDPNAVVAPGVQLGKNVRIGPFCNVASGCCLGDGVLLDGHVHLGRDVTIGPDCILHPGVVIQERCTIGARTILHSNAVIGSDGFGFRPSEDGTRLLGIPHIGTVRIGDDVEIGSCTCVDRGKFGATAIGDCTKIDNLCQVGHNCMIGRMCVICARVGIGGSTEIGDGTQIGGRVGIADHLVIGSNVSIGASSGVMNDIPDGEIWYGTPAGERSRILREQVAIRKLPEWSKRLRRLFAQDEAKSIDK